MAVPPANSTEEISEAVTRSNELVSAGTARRTTDGERARRVEAMTLRLAGLTEDSIAERMGVSYAAVEEMIHKALERAENTNVEQMRTIENQRLDRAQTAIWQQVLNGDLRSIDTFLRISQHRARINGLNAPTKVDVNLGIRHEMEQALAELENVAAEAVVIEGSVEGEEK